MITQNESILTALLAGRRLTPLDALRSFGCNRLAARINELRGVGYGINKDMVEVETADGRTCHVACYWMA